ncbi:MAG: T9SS type A sorting domain-containing protein [Saprospiraceae bacterium]
MNQYFLKNILLLLAAWGCGNGQLIAQNPDWPIVPTLQHFTTLGVPPSSSTMPGTYTTPYFASNCAQDEYGNLMFYVVNEKIYDNTGNFIGSTAGLFWDSNGKDILIVPDPNDCNSRLVLSAYADIITPQGGSSYYKWFLDATRVSKTGVVQPNIFSYPIGGNDNYFMSMVLSQPESNGDRFWYVVTSGFVTKFKITSGGINLIGNVPLGYIAQPTDAEISPTGDRLMWTEASNNFHELRWMDPNTWALSSSPLVFASQYQAYGLEFMDNASVLVSATKTSGIGPSSGIFKYDFINSASQVVANAAYAESQLEKALDGNIYAASAGGLLGIGPSGTTTIPGAVQSNYFGGSFTPLNYYYSLPKQLDYENYSTVFACCPPNVTITGVYSVPLTESQTWIKTFGACSIAAGFTVKLDADPVAGYVELNTGFEANASLNVVFIAQAFNGCAPGAPLRPQAGIRDDIALQAAVGVENATFRLFPNPTTGEATLEFDQATPISGSILVSDLMGRTISQETFDAGSSQHRISLGNAPSGIYIVRVLDGGKVLWSGKLVKE